MRVLYLNTKFQGGGAERVARQLYEGIGTEGVDSFMLVGKEDESDPRYEIIYESLPRRRWNWVYGKLTSNARLDDRYAAKKILNCIREHQIDLVHIHNIHGNYMGIRNVREIAAVIPVVWTLHDGFVCKAPVYRKTPLGREIADLLVAVNRPYGKSDYIPCIAWGRNARYATGFEVGGRIRIWGRVQSREYTKRIGEEESERRVAYEVSVSKLECVEQ